MKLKQSDRRGFSARSTGALDTKSLPTRSFKSKSHQERISSSCIRFGEYETLNFSIGILPEDIVLFHALYRTSIKGRKDLINIMFSDDDDVIKNIDASYTSRVAEIFNVILKSLGVGLEFLDDNELVETLNADEIQQFELNGETILCTEYDYYMLQRASEIKEIILRENPVVTGNQLTHLIEEAMKTMKFINGPLTEELGDLTEIVEKENQAIFERLQAEKLKKESEELANDLDQMTTEE